MNSLTFYVVLAKLDHTMFKHTSFQASAFKTRHLLVPMGSDFGYSRPDLWFKNMDEAIQLVRRIQCTLLPVSNCTSHKNCTSIHIVKEEKLFRYVSHLTKSMYITTSDITT